MAKATASATATATVKRATKPAKSTGGTTSENFAIKVSDDAVKKATGKDWGEWFKLLDKAGCAKMNHKEIVAVVERHLSGGWWGQMVTVGYEQARGLRKLYESCDGVFQASSSKTVNVPVGRLFDAWDDPKQRAAWLGREHSGGLLVRKATRPKSLRVTWSDGRTNVDVNLFPKGDDKSYVSLQHTKLADAHEVVKMKEFWAPVLDKLKAFVER